MTCGQLYILTLLSLSLSLSHTHTHTHTHTHSACDSACNVGLMKCYGFSSGDCCPYYNDDMCVSDCPGVLEPDDDFDCNCTGFFVDPPTCQGIIYTVYV